jgi:hypothetical protein
MWTNASGVQQCRHIPNLTGCFPTGFPIMALPYELRVLIWRHAACLRHAISTDLHEADLELCWYLDTPAVPVDRFSHALTSQWPSPGTAHLLAFNRELTWHCPSPGYSFASVPVWARLAAFKLNSIDPSGKRFWSGVGGVFHELKSSWRPSWCVLLCELVPEWYDHYLDVRAVLQDGCDSDDEGGRDMARAHWLLHAFSNEPAR